MFAGTVGAPKLRSKALPSSAAGKAKTATSSGTARSAPPPADKAGDAMRETYSGLRIKNRLVSKSDMEMHMRNRLVVSLAQLPTTPAAKLEDPNIDWVTFGVLVSKGLTKTASSGSKYMLWQLSDLGGNAASVFLFGKAYEAHWKELEGAAVAVLNAKVLPNRSQGGGSPSLSVNQPGEIAKLGMSLDCGTCEGRRKDGVRCTMVINKAQGRFCRFHAAAQLKAIDRTGRAELQGSRRPATRPAAGSAKRGVSSARGRIIGVPMHGVYSAAGATGATGAAGGAGGAQGRGPSVAQQQKQRDQAQSQSQELARKMNMRTRGALGQGFRCMSGTKTVVTAPRAATASAAAAQLRAPRQAEKPGKPMNGIDFMRSFAGVVPGGSVRKTLAAPSAEGHGVQPRRQQQQQQLLQQHQGSLDRRSRGPLAAATSAPHSNMRQGTVPRAAAAKTAPKAKGGDALGRALKAACKPSQGDSSSTRKPSAPVQVPAESKIFSSPALRTQRGSAPVLGRGMASASSVDLEISPGDAQQHSLLASSLQQRGVTMPTASAGSLADKVIAAASSSLTSAKRSRGQSSSAVPQPDGKRGRTATATKAASQKGAQRNGAFSEAFKDFAVGDLTSARAKALLAKKAKHATEAEQEQHDRLSESLGKLEQKQQYADHVDSVTKMNVKVYICAECNGTTERFPEMCRNQGHRVSSRTAVKRFFECSGCKNRTSTIDKKLPSTSCGKCGAAAWRKSSMRRESKGPALLPTLKPRGEEVEFSLRGGFF